MEQYGNVPLRRSSARSNGALSIESLADEALAIQKSQGGKPKKLTKSAYYEKVVHRVNELTDVLEEYMAPKIPEAKCYEVQKTLEDLKLVIETFVKGLKVHRQPLPNAEQSVMTVAETAQNEQETA